MPHLTSRWSACRTPRWSYVALWFVFGCAGLEYRNRVQLNDTAPGTEKGYILLASSTSVVPGSERCTWNSIGINGPIGIFLRKADDDHAPWNLVALSGKISNGVSLADQIVSVSPGEYDARLCQVHEEWTAHFGGRTVEFKNCILEQQADSAPAVISPDDRDLFGLPTTAALSKLRNARIHVDVQSGQIVFIHVQEEHKTTQCEGILPPKYLPLSALCA